MPSSYPPELRAEMKTVLRRARLRAGLTQAGAASLLGVAERTVAEWEQSRRPVLPACWLWVQAAALFASEEMAQLPFSGTEFVVRLICG